jgi:AraC-like DNA-binding protein
MLVRALVEGVERAGVSRADFLASAGITQLPLDDIRARIPCELYAHVVQEAIASTRDPALGLHMGERAGIGSFDVLGHLAEHGPCLRDALRLAAHYGRIVNDGPRLELYEDGAVATLRMRFLSGNAPATRLCAEFSTVALLRLVRRFVGSDIAARGVFFAYPAPAHRAEYTRVFEGREQFAHEFTGLELERSWLDRTQHGRSPELSALLETRAKELLATVEGDAPAAARAARCIAAHLERGRPTMQAIARDLGMSDRSLRRRLRDEGTAFNTLVDEALTERAQRMLTNPRCSIQETAYAMGFATPAAFARAFKRWTGLAPSAFRPGN